ncbi:hypothetical protein MSAN_00811200 [Mycena sanguinolenta]|uniref:Uncharacterized protein n=1 Tax=Mycena sanguinolenta TaxID=230812 RepID=A0A8H7DCW2_9AGAR|nr:hypothetical protein MSAN_00811200 [Mycena sanguinolenta]
MAQTARYTGTPREAYTPRYRRSLRRKVCRLKHCSAYLANRSETIAGIITARICADHFERVIIIDPEIEDPEKPKTRILQYNASHVFLSLFVEGARRLWSNFDAEMIAVGGRFNIADTQIHYSGIPLLNPYHDYLPGQFPRTLNMRRSLAQKVLHRLLMSSNVTRLAGTVRGVRATEDRTSIETVTVRQLDGSHLSLDNVALVAGQFKPL